MNQSNESTDGMKETILIVDDEDGILDLMDTLLGMEGYNIIRASSGEEAMQVSEGKAIDLVVSDYKMPGMNGVELFAQIKERFPDAPRILVTAFADADIAMEAINKGGAYRFLRKPWDPTELINEVKTALDHIEAVKAKHKLEILLDDQKKNFEVKVSERTSKLNKAVEDLTEANESITASYEQILQSDKLSTLGLMAGTVAHDIANPLTVILTRAKLITMGTSTLNEVDNEHVEIIIRNSKKIEKLIRSITRFAKSSKGEFESVDVRDVLRETTLMLSKAMSTTGIDVVEEFGIESPMVMADMNQLEQVFTNLMQNAIQAMGGPGKITLRITRVNGFIRTEIEDTGPGIEESAIKGVFEAFYTTKDEGTGLGLNICRRIVHEHQGEIQVESEVGVGTRFTVDLPVYKDGK